MILLEDARFSSESWLCFVGLPFAFFCGLNCFSRLIKEEKNINATGEQPLVTLVAELHYLTLVEL